MTREEFFYQCIDVIEHWLNGNRKISDLREVTDKLYDEVTKPHWISVHDELPPEEDGQFSKTVFAYAVFNDDLKDVLRDFYINDNGGVERGYYDYHYNKWFLIGGMEGKTITHWMPMPEAPILANFAKTCKNLKGGEG